MAKKRKAQVQQLFECDICQGDPFPHNASHIARHKAGQKHKRLLELKNCQSTLEDWGIVFIGDNGVQYVCTNCDTTMDLSFTSMKEHFETKHRVHLQLPDIPIREVSKVLS